MIGSQADYARHRGISKQAVNKAVKAGTIPLMPDGKIDFAEADRARADNGDPARRLSLEPESPAPTPSGRATTEPKPEPEPAAEAAAGGPPEAGGLTFNAAKTAREAYQAKIAQLDYEQRVGQLLPRREVEDAMATSGRKIRQGLDGLVRWAGELDAAARNGGVDAVRLVLRDRVRALETLIVDSLNLLGDDGDEEDEGS